MTTGPARVRVPFATLIQRLHARLWSWATLPPQDGRRGLGIETTGGHLWRLRQDARGVHLEKLEKLPDQKGQ